MLFIHYAWLLEYLVKVLVFVPFFFFFSFSSLRYFTKCTTLTAFAACFTVFSDSCTLDAYTVVKDFCHAHKILICLIRSFVKNIMCN